MRFVARLSLPSNITCSSERVVKICRQNIPSANAAKKAQSPAPRHRKHCNLQCYSTRYHCLRVSTHRVFKHAVDGDGLIVFKTFSYHEKDTRLVCIYEYKDEKILHRRSNVNEIVPAGRTNFSSETLDDFIAEVKKNLDEELQLLLSAFLHDTLICDRSFLG